MTEIDIDNKTSGDHIDVTIGKEYKVNATQDSNKYYEREMLTMMKKQTHYLKQINSMVSYFFTFIIIVIVITFIF